MTRLWIVGEATGGLQAVQLVEKLKSNVLILDMMMPDLNGLDVLKQVKERSPVTCSVVLSFTVLGNSRRGSFFWSVQKDGLNPL